MDFGSDSPLSLLWTISAFVAFVCFCSRNYGLTGGARTGTEFEQKVAKVTKGGADAGNGGRLMRAGGAVEAEALPDPPGCFFIWPGWAKCPTRAAGWSWLRTSKARKKGCPRIPAVREQFLAAKRWRGGSRSCCYGSTARMVEWACWRSGRNRVCATDMQ